MKTPTTYLTPPQIAKQLGVDVHKVLAWIRSGELKALNMAQDRAGLRPRFRVPGAALDAFTNSRQFVPDPPQPPRRRRLPGNVTEYF